MKKRTNRWGLRLAVISCVSCAALAAGTLAAEPGSAEDPLVTLSYLEETFMGQILAAVEEEIAQRLGQGSDAGAVFSVVTLTQGQVLTGEIGCEVLLRIGSAVCTAPSAPGLIDETAGSVLNDGGSLQTNHLYMMTIEGRGIRAASGTVKLLVRGGCSIS